MDKTSSTRVGESLRFDMEEANDKECFSSLSCIFEMMQ